MMGEEDLGGGRVLVCCEGKVVNVRQVGKEDWREHERHLVGGF